MRPRRPGVEGQKRCCGKRIHRCPRSTRNVCRNWTGHRLGGNDPGGPAFPLERSYDALRRFATGVRATGPFHLHRRAPHRPERAKDTAISRLGTKQRFASLALVVGLARVRGHRLLFCEAAPRAGDDRGDLNRTHRISLAYASHIDSADNTSAAGIRPKPLKNDMPRIHWRSAALAGIAAGVVATLAQIALWWVSSEPLPAILFRDARLTAAIIMGRGGVPPPRTFGGSVMLIATLVHFALSIAYGLALSVFISSLSTPLSLLAGAVFGLSLRAIHMCVFTFVF